MALKTVVGEDSPQIRVVGKKNPVKIPSLALEPAGGAEDCGNGRHRRVLVGPDLDADALIELQGQQVIDDVEPLRTIGPIDAANIHQQLELAFGIVAQKT